MKCYLGLVLNIDRASSGEAKPSKGMVIKEVWKGGKMCAICRRATDLGRRIEIMAGEAEARPWVAALSHS